MKNRRFEGGYLSLKFNVSDGRIQHLRYTAIFGKKDIRDIENLLKNIKFKEGIIYKTLNSLNFEEYFAGITTENFIECMFY